MCYCYPQGYLQVLHILFHVIYPFRMSSMFFPFSYFAPRFFLVGFSFVILECPVVFVLFLFDPVLVPFESSFFSPKYFDFISSSCIVRHIYGCFFWGSFFSMGFLYVFIFLSSFTCHNLFIHPSCLLFQSMFCFFCLDHLRGYIFYPWLLL